MALEADLFGFTEDGAEFAAGKGDGGLEVERLGVDAVKVGGEIFALDEFVGEAGEPARGGDGEAFVVAVKFGSLFGRFGERDEAAGVGDVGGVDGDFAGEAVVADAEERGEAAVEIFAGERGGEIAGVAVIVEGTGNQIALDDVGVENGRAGEIGEEEAVPAAGAKGGGVVEVGAELDGVVAGEAGGGGVGEAEAAVDGEVAAAGGGEDEGLLHPAAEFEGVGGGDAAGFEGVAENFVLGEVAAEVDERAPGAVHVDHGRTGTAAKGVVVAFLILELLVVGNLEGELAKGLFEHGGDDVVGAVEVVAETEDVETAVEAAEKFPGAVGQADADGLAFEEGEGAAAGDAGAVDGKGRVGGGALEDLPVGSVIPAVVGRKGAAGGGNVAHGGGVVGAAAFVAAGLGVEGEDRVFEGTVGGGEIDGAETLVAALDVAQIGAVDHVQADRELAGNLTIDVDLETVGAQVGVIGEEGGGVGEAGALGGGSDLAAGGGVAEHEGI